MQNEKSNFDKNMGDALVNKNWTQILNITSV